jgi:hypothetical protein
MGTVAPLRFQERAGWSMGQNMPPSPRREKQLSPVCGKAAFAGPAARLRLATSDRCSAPKGDWRAQTMQPDSDGSVVVDDRHLAITETVSPLPNFAAIAIPSVASKHRRERYAIRPLGRACWGQVAEI